MENCPFIDDFPIKTSIYKGFPMAMLNNQMVILYIIMMAVIGIMTTVQSHVPKNQPLVHAINGSKIPARKLFQRTIGDRAKGPVQYSSW